MKVKGLLFLIILLPTLLFAESVGTLYKKGIEELNKKNFNEAIEIFKKIEKIKKSPGIYYNLALAHWNKEEKGFAVYYLKKSLRLFPLYQRSIKALKTINKEAKTGEAIFFTYIFSLGFLLILLLTIQILLYKKFFFKRKVNILKILAVLLILIISFSSFYYSGFKLFKEKRGIVVKKVEAKVFSEPDPSSIPLYKIQEGEEVKILSIYGGWYKITKDNILLGWIKGDSVKLY